MTTIRRIVAVTLLAALFAFSARAQTIKSGHVLGNPSASEHSATDSALLPIMEQPGSGLGVTGITGTGKLVLGTGPVLAPLTVDGRAFADQFTGGDIGAQTNAAFASFGASPACGAVNLPTGNPITMTTEISGIGNRLECMLSGQGLNTFPFWAGSTPAIQLTAPAAQRQYATLKDFSLYCNLCVSDGIQETDGYENSIDNVLVVGFPGPQSDIPITSLVNGQKYLVHVTGSSDFTTVGAFVNQPKVLFTATGPGTGTGRAFLYPTYAGLHLTGDGVGAENSGNWNIINSDFFAGQGDGILFDGSTTNGGVASFSLFGTNSENNAWGSGIDMPDVLALNRLNVYGGDFEGNDVSGFNFGNWGGVLSGSYIEGSSSPNPPVNITGSVSGGVLEGLKLLGEGGATPYCMVVDGNSTALANGGVVIQGNYCTSAAAGYYLLLPGGGTFGPNAGTQTVTFAAGTAGVSSNTSAAGVARYRWVDTVGHGIWVSDDAVQAPEFMSTSGLPGIQSCGTSPAMVAGSTNASGQFTMGTGTPSTCTVAFWTNGVNIPYLNNAFCTVSPVTSAAAAAGIYVASSTKTNFVIDLTTPASSLTFNYVCMGS